MQTTIVNLRKRSHDWKFMRRSVKTKIDDTCFCLACGRKQVCIGHYGFMDADPMPQW